MDSETALCKRPMIISAPPVSQMCQRIGMMEAQPTVYKHLAAISVLHASQEFEMGGELCHLGRTTDTWTVLCGHSVVIPNKLISHMCGCGGRLGILFHVRWCTAAITAPPVLKMCLRTGMADARNVVWKRPMAIPAHFVSQTCQRGGWRRPSPLFVCIMWLHQRCMGRGCPKGRRCAAEIPSRRSHKYPCYCVWASCGYLSEGCVAFV